MVVISRFPIPNWVLKAAVVPQASTLVKVFSGNAEVCPSAHCVSDTLPCGRDPASRAARQPATGVRRGAGKGPQKGRSRTADMGLRLGAEAPYETFGADQTSGEATLERGRLM